MAILLRRVDWKQVNRQTRQQVRNREVHCPPISLFRWWARRPHALIRALLEASDLARGGLVSDPFSGGGTVAIEAALHGAIVYAQDLNPWATWGLSTAFDSVDASELQRGVDLFLKALAESPVSTSYRTECPRHGASETNHAFWVRRVLCSYCSKSVHLYPYSLLTVASRANNEAFGYFGCSRCGAINKRRVGVASRCSECHGRFADVREPLLQDRIIVCPHCDTQLPADTWAQRNWKLVLVQRSCLGRNRKRITHFDEPTIKDIAATTPAPFRVPRALTTLIPASGEAKALRRLGYRRWSDLYPPRQLGLLLEAARVAAQLDIEERVRNRIHLAVAGASEMAGYLSRWDRFHPKAFEALANHRYSATSLAVETNLIGRRGRGTLSRRLAASITAAAWMNDHHQCERKKAVSISTGSSTRQNLGNGKAALIITDPPYYDAVQYGELSSLFRAWGSVVNKTGNWNFESCEEAVPNASESVAYEKTLRAIFVEAARTLADTGRLLLTYHSTDFRGWTALGLALDGAGFDVVALGVAHSENEKDHAKRGSLAFTRDLVIECTKRSTGKSVRSPLIVTNPRTAEQRELLAAGVAIATYASKGTLAMLNAFEEATARLQTRRIAVRDAQRKGDE